MRPRGWLLSVVLLGTSLIFSSPSHATGSPPSLTLSIPGPLRGCYYYGHNTSDSLRAVLDLVRPSAFVTNPYGNLVGAVGPIVQSELVSLTPQTVVYTIDPTWHWTNGLSFTGNDLKWWYAQARTQPSSFAEGYRSIASLTVAPTLDSVKVVFAKPVADWNTMFHDLNFRGTSTTCTLTSLAQQPSLGAYRLSSLTSHGAVLVRNPLWKGPSPYYSKINVTTALSPGQFPVSSLVDFRSAMTQSQLTHLAAVPALQINISSSNQLLVVGFSPRRPLTYDLSVRQFLQWTINRQTLINRLEGPISYLPALAPSVLYAQGQNGYSGPDGVGPSDQSSQIVTTTIPTSPEIDCVACASPILAEAGFSKMNGHWRTPQGAIFTVRLGVGPSPQDRATGSMIAAQWRNAGVVTNLIPYGSEHAVAFAVNRGRVDTGVMTVTQGVVPSISARSWTGFNFGDGYDIGWRSPLIDQWYASAQDTFNPVAAAPSYASIDQYITTQAWERPLFSDLTIVTSAQNVAGVYPSTTLSALVDQLPSWVLNTSTSG